METAVAARVSIPERQVSGNVPSEESRNHVRGAAGKTQSFSALFSSTTSEDEAETDTKLSRSSSSDALQSNDKERRPSSRNGASTQSAIPSVPDLFTLLPLSLKLPLGLGLQLPGAPGLEKVSPNQSAAEKEGHTSASSSNSTTTEMQPSPVSSGDLAFGLHLSSLNAVNQSEDPQPKLPLNTDPGQQPKAGVTDPVSEPAAITSADNQVSAPAVMTVALKDPSDSGKHTPDISAVSSILAVNPDSGQGNGGTMTATSLSAPASQPAPTLAANAPAVSEIRTAEAPRTTPVRQISIDLPGTDLSKVAIQLTEKNGDLRVSVRTADANLAGDLRLDLKDLVSNLKQEGFKVESWAPAAPVVETQTHSHDHHESGNSEQQQNPGGGDTSQRDGSPRDQRRQRQAYPTWITEFETHIDNTGTARTQNS